MNSSQVLALIDDIGATASKNDKQAMVTGGMQTELFKRVCEYTYNPFKTYNMRQIPERRVSEFGGSDSSAEFDDQTWQLLDNLIARKLTGTAARDAVKKELERLTHAASDLLVRIIRKDLRAGFSESTCNKACKGLIPEFPYMRCSLPKDAKLETWPWAGGVPVQEKADGMFANVDHELSGAVCIRSRQGTDFPVEKFPGVVAEIQARTQPGHQHHGEFVVVRGETVLPREIGNGIMNHVINGGDFGEGEYPLYLIWDQIPLTSVVPKGKFERPYIDRLRSIIEQLKSHEGRSVALIQTKIVRSLADAYAFAGALMQQGKEGAVVKHPKAIWKDGTSKEQVKIKLEFEVDLEIESIVPGAEGTKVEGRAGAFACRSSCGALRVNVTVKNEALRDRVDANPEEFIGKIIPVTANDIMKPSDSSEFYSLFLPRMSEADYRKDKTVADDLARIVAQKEAAIFGEKLKEAA